MFSFPNQNSTYAYDGLYTPSGERKYLTERERDAFLTTVTLQEQETVKYLCLALVYTGCRLSEALALTPNNILVDEEAILIRSLKKRGKIVYRKVPLPKYIVAELIEYGQTQSDRLFPWGRTQALAHVRWVMAQSHIFGARATTRGLRHTFATHGLLSGVPMHLIQRWLGNSSIETTAIYANVLGAEERAIAERMWRIIPTTYNL